MGIGFFRSTSRRFADGVEAVGIVFFRSTFVQIFAQFQSKMIPCPQFWKGLWVWVGGELGSCLW